MKVIFEKRENDKKLVWTDLEVGQWFIFKFRQDNNTVEMKDLMLKGVDYYEFFGGIERGTINIGLEVVPVDIKYITLLVD